jgi:hypothetical protein
MLLICVQPPLSKYVGCDEEAQKQQQSGGNEQLRREGRTVVVDLGAGSAADRTAGLDHGAPAVCADQMLAAHLEPLPVVVPRRSWRDLEP